MLYPIQHVEWPISPYELSHVLNILVEVEINMFYVQWKKFGRGQKSTEDDLMCLKSSIESLSLNQVTFHTAAWK